MYDDVSYHFIVINSTILLYFGKKIIFCSGFVMYFNPKYSILLKGIILCNLFKLQMIRKKYLCDKNKFVHQ